MTRAQRAHRRVLAVLVALGAAGCGGSHQVPPAEIPPPEAEPQAAAEIEAPPREAPPPSGPRRDVTFPAVARTTLANGLEVNTAEWHELPIVYLRLVVRSGSETDPADLPGLASLVADMLEEGTRHRSSAELAEAVEFLGADISTSADSENVVIAFRAMRDQLPEAMRLVAEVATQPAFRQDELDKLKRRELDRLALSARNPIWLVRREFYKRLYGSHPYAHVDTTEEAVRRVKRTDLQRWHRANFVPSNAFLVVTGDVTPDDVQRAATEAFGGWRGRTVPAAPRPAPPARESREIVVVDRPGSAQSVIVAGNLAIDRDDPEWIPLEVANQVLGGSAASRLFMDLRERRSLTYGAYSAVHPRIDVGPFVVSTSVRTEVTNQAVDAIFEHLDRIVAEAPSEGEIHSAESFLADSFPLRIDTPGNIAQLVAELRTFGLPDDYYDTYRTRVQAVTPEDALTAAQASIHPAKALVVIVGEASAFAESLRALGPVTVVNATGEVTGHFDPATPESPAAAPEVEPSAAPAEPSAPPATTP
jgi:predicted Zn-dependent peptidase